MAIDDTEFQPSVPSERQRPQANRTVLGVLVVLLGIAVLLALWFLVIDDDGDGSGDAGVVTAGPTPIAVPSSTPTPIPDAVVATTGGDDSLEAEATPAPTTVPTTVPVGFEACAPATAPSATATYIVDTTTTPLNQRILPSVASELAGSFDPGQTGLVFTGQCLVNLEDEYTWWEINNGSADVWVASDFVSAQ